jgi:hypothetical protein
VRQRLFTILSAASLLLFLAACVLWVRSYWVAERVSYWGNTRVLCLHSSEGRAAVTVATGTIGPESRGAYGYGLHHEVVKPAPAIGSRWGFAYNRIDVSGGSWAGRLYIVAVPHWLPTTTAALLPAAWLGRRWRRARKHRAGLCRACGYDLRATPERCPECGAMVTRVGIGA